MEHTAAISEPRDLARLLASYARDALQRVERAVAEEDSLQPIREALEQALGMRFEDERAEEFFRSTLVQTLFYGVFAAWVLWARAGKSGRFRWKDTVDYLRAPVLRMLFHQLTDPGRLERLELVDVLDWTEAALERVDRDEFLKRFSQGEAVQYFYEPFLQEFDPELRKQLGVWYTPREVVRYMVARRRPGAARRPGYRQGTGRQARLRARPLLRHGRVPGRDPAPHRRDRAGRWTRRVGRRVGARGGGDAGVRLRDHARARWSSLTSKSDSRWNSSAQDSGTTNAPASS